MASNNQKRFDTDEYPKDAIPTAETDNRVALYQRNKAKLEIAAQILANRLVNIGNYDLKMPDANETKTVQGALRWAETLLIEFEKETNPKK